jgi:hypothetical protein
MMPSRSLFCPYDVCIKRPICIESVGFVKHVDMFVHHVDIGFVQHVDMS